MIAEKMICLRKPLPIGRPGRHPPSFGVEPLEHFNRIARMVEQHSRPTQLRENLRFRHELRDTTQKPQCRAPIAGERSTEVITAELLRRRQPRSMRQERFMNRGGLLELFEIAARLNRPEQRYGKIGLGICGSQEVRNGGSILAAKVQLHAEQVCAVRVEIRRLRDDARPRRDKRLEVAGNDAAHASSELVRGFPRSFARRGDFRYARHHPTVSRAYSRCETPCIIDEMIRSRDDQACSGRAARRNDAMPCRLFCRHRFDQSRFIETLRDLRGRQATDKVQRRVVGEILQHLDPDHGPLAVCSARGTRTRRCAARDGRDGGVTPALPNRIG